METLLSPTIHIRAAPPSLAHSLTLLPSFLPLSFPLARFPPPPPTTLHSPPPPMQNANKLEAATAALKAKEEELQKLGSEHSANNDK